MHVPGEWGRPPQGALDIHLRGTLRVLHQAKAQAAIHTQRDAARLIHQRWQCVQAGGQRLQGVVPAIQLRADGDRISGMRLGGGDILREGGHTTLQPGDVRWQSPQLAPGQELLVGMVLLEDMQPVQRGIRLGEGQHGGVARGDGFHLGVGQLLGADVLGLPDRAVAGEHLGDELRLGFEGLPHIRVKTALCHVAVDRHLLVGIPLT